MEACWWRVSTSCRPHTIPCAPVRDHLGPDNYLGGRSPAWRLPELIEPLNTHPRTALPTRGQDPGPPSRRQDTRPKKTTIPQHSNTALRPAEHWPSSLAGQYKHRDIWVHAQLCQEPPLPHCPPPLPQKADTSSGIPWPVARLQDLALPVSNVTITTEHSLLHKRGSEPKSLLDLTLPTSKQHQPQGLLGFCSQLPHDQAPLTSSQDCTRQSLATNQAVGQPSLPDHTNKHVITTEGPMQPS